MDEVQKTCTKCHLLKPLDAFNKAKRGKFGRSAQCRECVRKYTAANAERDRKRANDWYYANKEYAAAKSSEYRKTHKVELSLYGKAYYQANKERINERNRQWVLDNQEQHRETQKAWRELNAERLREYREEHREEIALMRKRWYEDNREHSREYFKAWCAANFERYKQAQANWCAANPNYAREWRKAHPDSHRAAQYRRRAQMFDGDYEPVDLAQVWEKSNSLCFLCTTPMDRSYSFPHPAFPSLEHIIPLSRGGTHTLENLTYTHLKCNLTKQAKLIEELALPLPSPLDI